MNQSHLLFARSRRHAALVIAAALALLAPAALATALFNGYIAPPAGAYNGGDRIDIGVKYTELVFVTGSPRLRLSAGAGQIVYANYLAGSESDVITFRYTVAAPTNGIALAVVGLDLNGGSMSDLEADPVDPFLLDDAFATAIDTTAPSVVAVRRFLPAEPNSTGNTFVWRVSFSEPVNAPPPAAFTLVRSGVSGGMIDSIRGLGSEWYVTVTGVAAGYGQIRLDVNGGLITDPAGNPAQDFAAGERYGRLATGLVAWGDNASDQIGVAGATHPNATTPPTGAIGSQTVAFAAQGRSHSLVLTREGNLFAWGNGADGKLGNLSNNSSPSPVAVKMDGALAGQSILTIAAGSNHSVALSRLGIVFTWGNNDCGQLARGDTVSVDQPVYIEDFGTPLAGKSIVAVAAGDQHTLALSADGRVFAWGMNANGQLGNGAGGPGAYSTVPVEASGVLSGKHIVAIAAGAWHSLALSSDGQLYVWGSNAGSTSTVPVEVPSGALFSSTVVAISAGGAHNLALTAEGRLFAWGTGSSGELGISSGLVASATAPTPVVMNGALAGRTIVALAAGWSYSRALTADGAAFTWGYNASGQLGQGTVATDNPAGSPNNTPGAVSLNGPLAHSSVVGLGAGFTGAHTLALAHPRAYAHMVSTGAAGTFGTGATVDLMLQFSEAVTITGTPSLRLGLVNGYATAGYLSGSGTSVLTFRYTVQPGDWAPAGIATIDFDPTGTSDRYGLAVDYQLPTGTNLSGLKIDARAPTPLELTRAHPYALTEASATTTASALTYRMLFDKSVTGVDPADFTLTTTGTATGTITNVLGNGDSRYVVVTGVTGSGAIRLDLKSTDTGITDTTGNPLSGGLTTGQCYYHIGATALLGCGYNSLGQVGLDTAGNNVFAPTSVPAQGALYGKTLTALATGFTHTLALCTDGSLAAWGDNNFGQLGCAHPESHSPSPVSVLLSGELHDKTVIAIAAGAEHCLALTSDGRVYAWGRNNSGQLGTATGDRDLPTAVSTAGALAGESVIAIAAGTSHSLALTASGRLLAWGSDTNQQLGNGSFGSSTTPTAVNLAVAFPGERIVSLAAGSIHSLALGSGGHIYAWGSNASGQVGNNGFIDVDSPVLIDLPRTVVALDAGEAHSLALAIDGALYAWGANDRHQLGDGTSINLSRIPVAADLTGFGTDSAVALAAGNAHSIVTTATGALFGWGDNYSSQLGSALPYTVERPTQLASGALAGANVVALPGGSRGNHSLVLANTAGDPLSLIEHWRLRFFDTPFAQGDAADSADPDADSRTNFVEYATGTDPINANSGPVAALAVTGTGATRRLTLTFSRIADPSITYTAEASDTLAAGSWTTIVPPATPLTGPVMVTDPDFMAGHARRFLRLRIIRAP